MPAPNIVSFVRDGFQNLVARLGVAGDKNVSNTYGLVAYSQQEVEAAYRTSWFRKIVDIPPLDMTREWRNWQADDAAIEKIEDEEKRLGIRIKARRGMQWGRLYGGAGLYMGIRNQSPAEPLDLDRVKTGDLEYVHCLSRYQLTVQGIENDPASPNFGAPKMYRLGASQPNVVDIHPSRVVRFIGNEIPPLSALGDGWGDSLWLAVDNAIKHADMTTSGIASLVQKARVDLFKIKGFMNGLATQEYEDRLLRRFNTAQALVSINNAMVIDADDDYQGQTYSFTGLPDVLKLYLMILAGVADIPATRMFGRSPEGMNATGESDMRNYYDMLSSRQEDELTPALNPIDEVLIRSSLGSRDKAIHFTWAPLWQMTPAELADINKKNAETDQVYVNIGVIPDSALAKAIQNRLIENSAYPGLEDAIAEAETAGDLPMIEERLTPEEEAENAVRVATETAKARPANQNRPPPRRAANDGTRLLLITDDDRAFRWSATDSIPAKAMAIVDATPRTLYVSRKVVNGAEIVAWAKGQGFDPVPAAELHVTIAFSRTPVDWMKISAPYDWGEVKGKRGHVIIPPGGPRIVEPLGDMIVLFFSSSTLTWRHEDIVRSGASWDYPDFQPHVSIAKSADGINLREVEPFRGEIELGPEIFEEIDTNR